MKYYTIQNNLILIADTEQALARFYNNVLTLPDDYEEGKYIVVDGELVRNHNWEEEKLRELKEKKYKEANKKAFEYLESGNAVYTYEEGKSIEATDGNIAKLGLALVNFILQQDYTSTIEWNTKENENVQLNAEQLQIIVAGLQGIQAEVWTVKFPAYNTAISEAETAEEVNAIVIDYNMDGEDEDIPVESAIEL